MLKVTLRKSEVVKIYRAVDNYAGNLYKRVWETDERTIALFLNEREAGPHSRTYLVFMVTLEFDSSIRPDSDDMDYLFEHTTDEPVGQLTIFAAGLAPLNPGESYSLHSRAEYDFLVELGVVPVAFESEVLCLWCKNINRFVSEDIGEDGLAECIHCGKRIRPIY
ncbi:MAG: hypothetical protein ACFFCK_06870 [Promethearchaeota archaeon]